ncbi:MAG TPA: choice-of-anchor tandem repeat GloVer-containing protein [Verrucomicrobiae bacterium]|nr:choice-of-anchor tandem repeat GloVer-containing protein [Verrucomicrobiae bacterium]
MNKGIRVGLAVSKLLRLVIAVIPLLLACRAFNANALTETNLHFFVGFPGDGTDSRAKLVQGNDGNFYGTTFGGGTNNNGIVFRMSPSGTESNLYSFVGFPSDGGHPNAGLVQGSDSNFYGTTDLGGIANSGTVFRISSSGSYTNLHSFVGYPTDGAVPTAGLVQGSDGNFYGVTPLGGTVNSGTVFRISSSGSYTNLYSFGINTNDGTSPSGGLVQGSDGNFYGTTGFGGTSTNCGTNGCGTVFRISPSGSYTNLYSFGISTNDGVIPSGALVQGSDGNFYGTAAAAGLLTACTNGCGMVFRISPSGSETNLYSFVGSPNDGQEPAAGLVQGSDGSFYGTTLKGGAAGSGTVFRISSSGSYSNLYSFKGDSTDGGFPIDPPVQGSNGNFYGTTQFGGTNGHGAIFEMILPLSPPPYPINQITKVQVAATNIIFSIPSIAGEIYQLQFSSSMNPTNWNNEGGSITSIGALLTLTNFGGASQPKGFYRFDITP